MNRYPTRSTTAARPGRRGYPRRGYRHDAVSVGELPAWKVRCGVGAVPGPDDLRDRWPLCWPWSGPGPRWSPGCSSS